MKSKVGKTGSEGMRKFKAFAVAYVCMDHRRRFTIIFSVYQCMGVRIQGQWVIRVCIACFCGFKK